MDFASQCFDLSEGLFDITSGVLRRAWTVRRLGSGSRRRGDRAPVAPGRLRQAAMGTRRDCCCQTAWNWISAASARNMRLTAPMTLLAARGTTPFLVNFGGDLRANRPPPHGPWQVGIERPDTEREASMMLGSRAWRACHQRRLASLLLKDGVRYGHILRSAHRLARTGRAALGDRRREQLHGSRTARHAGVAARRPCPGILGR